jgi:valyl-tRNA synthetase
MPFVTEAIWQEVYGEEEIIMVERWPKEEKIEENYKDFEVIKDVITSIRSWRSENKIEAGKLISAMICPGKNEKLVIENIGVVEKLARLQSLSVVGKLENRTGMASFLASGMEVAVDRAGLVDSEKEKARLEAEISMTDKYVKGLEGKLGNADFVSRAPAKVVDGEKLKLSEAKEKLDKLQNQLKSLP